MIDLWPFLLCNVFYVIIKRTRKKQLYLCFYSSLYIWWIIIIKEKIVNPPKNDISAFCNFLNRIRWIISIGMCSKSTLFLTKSFNFLSAYERLNRQQRIYWRREKGQEGLVMMNALLSVDGSHLLLCRSAY